MKVLLMTLLAILCVNLQVSCQTKSKQADMEKKTVVVYFSATGNTAKAAKALADYVKGDLYAITPLQPYTSADLDWRNDRSRSSIEMNDPASRPAMKGKMDSIGNYDVVFLGYPIWWDLAPRIINTFIESHNLNGKTVIPFATSGSSSITNSEADLKKRYPDIHWKDGKLLNKTNERIFSEWLDVK
ncbi:flavodoxin [uncultured Bacteroides sp.]|uniref:flavodoxin n=1 Tax=uncultured Bacteroides sp. TaxID=162156 RepID=UPI00260564FD|nr:flavodoxin [uncultured Bacteroides sp.]